MKISLLTLTFLTTTTSFLVPNTQNAKLTKTFMAGFGSSSTTNKKSKKNKSTPIKLKPKLQWDRYLALKECSIITAAVQKDDGDWIDVGYIKSTEDVPTDIAVARQRALIAEHAKRLYPLQVRLFYFANLQSNIEIDIRKR